jgi:hypothetical protein
MAVSQIRFGHTALLVRSGRFLPTSATFTWNPSNHNLLLELNFDRTMSPHVPDASTFDIIIDGTSHNVPDSTLWNSTTQLEVELSGVLLSPSTIHLSYNGSDPLFGDGGIDAVGAFANQVIPF